jgi:hypothetical protein
MYSLAYEMMVQVLRQLGYSGEFHAEVVPHAALKEGGRVVLVVHNGSIVSCFIFNKHGQKLYHDAEAQRQLPTFGVLNWRLASSSPTRTANPITPPTAPIIHRNVNPITPPFVPKVTLVEGERRSIPHRRSVSEAQVRTWSALERSVYFLADGVRSAEQIATLLSRPPALIEQIIQKLKASGAITQS